MSLVRIIIINLIIISNLKNSFYIFMYLFDYLKTIPKFDTQVLPIDLHASIFIKSVRVTWLTL